MDHEDELQVRAYYLWEKAGRPDGQAGEHWNQARRAAGLPAEDAPRQAGRAALTAENLENLLNAENTALLEGTILPDYLARQRWFGAKHRTIESLRIVAHAASIDQTGLLAQLEVKLDGSVERYSLPLAIVWEDQRDDELELARKLAIATVRAGGGEGLLTDAFYVPAFIRAIVAHTSASASLGSPEEGTTAFLPEPGAAGQLAGDGKLRWLSTEQSNSSVIIGGCTVMKLIRRLQEGIHPEAEMCRFLTRAGYEHSSPMLAEVVHTDRHGTVCSMLILERFVPNDGDTWTHSIDCFRAGPTADRDTPHVDAGRETRTGPNRGEHLNEIARAVGRRLGELHATLAKPGGDPAFAPEAASAEDVEAWRKSAVEQLEQAFDIIGKANVEHSSTGDPLAREMVERVARDRERIVAAVRDTPIAGSDAIKTRIHGDFHLGQVLWASGDACIIDFEGEPARPIESRRAKSSPLRDVAGLLRSISYADAYAAKPEDGSRADARDPEDRDASLEALRREAEESFSTAYVQATARDVFADAGGGEVSLLSLFLVEKAAYEVCYEAANRPEWLAIPLHGLVRVLTAFPGLKDMDGRAK
jgi:maltose alpha-D-glucosyltransferase / alpha-amylase